LEQLVIVGSFGCFRVPDRVPAERLATDDGRAGGAMADDGAPEIGLVLPTWPLRGGEHATWAEMRGLALDAEALGVDTLWVPDHLQRTVPGRPTFGFWECWTILAAAAAATTRIGIGPFVASTGFRNPALLAKMAATLDEVSGGRLVLGLGPGDPARDDSWRAFGFEADRPVTRFAEAVEIVTGMLRRPPLTFHGEFFRVEGADVTPGRPLPGRPPVWLAAKGDRTLSIAVRWGDAVNVNVALSGASEAGAIAARVATASMREARDPATLTVTGWARLSLRADGTAATRPGWIGGSPGEVAATLRAIRGTGMRHVTLYLGDADDPSPLPALTAPVLERFRPIVEALRLSG
jgi:alkanesulfonate monooxygenase SsuD/methylene tetrahydromethanopterin reductase-like flavin-dependent oxidoreductase (luciferase family)